MSKERKPVIFGGKEYRAINEDDVRRGFLLGDIKLVSDYDACVACKITIWKPFYFGGTDAECTTPARYVCDMDAEEIIRDICDTLEDFGTTFPEEWLIYRDTLDYE